MVRGVITSGVDDACQPTLRSFEPWRYSVPTSKPHPKHTISRNPTVKYRLIHPYLDGTRAKSRYRNKPAVGETSSNGTTGDMNEDVVFDIGKM